MTEKPPLTLILPDSKNGVPARNMLGTRLRHHGNGKLYIITGWCWLGATDEWGYLHSEWRDDGVPGVTIARPITHIYGRRSNGAARYTIEGGDL